MLHAQDDILSSLARCEEAQLEAHQSKAALDTALAQQQASQDEVQPARACCLPLA